ncbi:unnamed protein product [Notodromas monacha]|uniref:Transmembrane protein 268 n=1 Tax=Notodromas monacha TaxID=399045 RepID=A0A7R9BL42_9CRUS|nr:unnamed protein product [Notodromas monacha]CAG0916700.1 unnamed protein product [Notodromas monacha]
MATTKAKRWGASLSSDATSTEVNFIFQFACDPLLVFRMSEKIPGQPAGDPSKSWVKFEESNSSTGSVQANSVQLEVPEEAVRDGASVGTVIQQRPEQLAVTINDVIASAQDLQQARNNGIGSVPEAPRPNIRQGFANGDVIVTLLPMNTSWAWLTPAEFRPELVPEELMADGLTLTVEEYVQAMELLTNDYRFTLYNVFYKRLLAGWIAVGFLILLIILFSQLQHLALFGCGILWLVLNAAAIFMCMWIKVRLNRNLERCVASVNKLLLKHKILLGLDDRGRLSCHKVNLCFLYFDPSDCIKKLKEVIDKEEARGNVVNSDEGKSEAVERQRRRLFFRRRMDIEDQDIVISAGTGAPTRVSRKQERAERLFLRYSQRWAKDFLRKRLDWCADMAERLEQGATVLNVAMPPVPASTPGPGFAGILVTPQQRPRHLPTAHCPCQYVEEHLKYKPAAKRQTQCVNWCNDFANQGAFD